VITRELSQPKVNTKAGYFNADKMSARMRVGVSVHDQLCLHGMPPSGSKPGLFSMQPSSS
jgi:hypothetical protein